MSIWGKVFGGFTGLALGGPLGAVLGAVAGHAYDTIKSDRMELNSSIDERQVAFTTAIIVLSANAMEEHKQSALAAGADDYDTKPVDLKRLLDKMNRFL